MSSQVAGKQLVDISRRAGWRAVNTSFNSASCEFVLLNLTDPTTGVGPWSIFNPLAEYYGLVGEGH